MTRIQLLTIPLVLWLATASLAWQTRNPTANDTTLITEFVHVIRFEKLDKYQGQP